eukprot:scaffold6115_cov403-Prasinococcus_capsulatus_cf.AAC.1
MRRRHGGVRRGRWVSARPWRLRRGRAAAALAAPLRVRRGAGHERPRGRPRRLRGALPRAAASGASDASDASGASDVTGRAAVGPPRGAGLGRARVRVEPQRPRRAAGVTRAAWH